MERDFIALLTEKTKAGKIKWRQTTENMLSTFIETGIFYLKSNRLEYVKDGWSEVKVSAEVDEIEKLYKLASETKAAHKEKNLEEAYNLLELVDKDGVEKII